MKYFFTFVLSVFFSFQAQAGMFGAETFCTNPSNCNAGEIIHFKSPKYIPFYCDINKNVVVANGRVTCFYIGERRKPKASKKWG